MKKALSEIKRLGKSKTRKPKELEITEYLNMIQNCSYSIIKNENNFRLFCRDEEVSPEVARKMQEFADTESFFSYITIPVFAVVTNPEQKLVIPTKENAEVRSENFAVVILKKLAKDLETQSVESVCTQAEKDIAVFMNLIEANMTPELTKKFGDITI